MAKKTKCPKCGKRVEVRELEWGKIYKFHEVIYRGKKIECPGSGQTVE